MTNRWHRAIGFALTGIDLDLAPQATPDLDALVTQLAERGWDADRMIRHAHQAAASELWPHPIPDALRAGLGAAQLHAAIRLARVCYGLEVLAVLPPSRRTSLDANERRLLADVPPHFGRS